MVRKKILAALVIFLLAAGGATFCWLVFPGRNDKVNEAKMTPTPQEGDVREIKMTPTPQEYNVREMIQYSGPSSRIEIERSPTHLPMPIARPFVFFGYQNTDQNDKAIDRLLSSQNIPFFIMQSRTPSGWHKDGLDGWVPVEKGPETQRILSAAVKAGLLELEELESRPTALPPGW